MSGRMARNKGKRGEREAAKEVARLFGVEAKRGVQFKGGENSPDIETGIKGVHFEVKRVEAFKLYDALQQAEDDCNGKAVPVVLHRRNGKQWVMVLNLEDAPALARILNNLEAE